ncbi:hypothetical protein BJ875DRAFT_448345 [Amylocarpus encephaloides]|uniref:Uncharacterized protein n=1 Tax=Amylocarpus encephaloides TaxID=45428 RepID=A0A9P7YUX9_9HELO|nr:hypothetical protein BJ875DRAFT_448345 [Amylocarpus encephaloides]
MPAVQRYHREIVSRKGFAQDFDFFRDITGNGSDAGVNFKFSHISEDRAVAQFVRDSRRDGFMTDKQADELDRNTLESAWMTYLGTCREGGVGANAEPDRDENDKITNDRERKFRARNILEPPQILRIHRDVNDTPVPGLRFDFDNFTMTCTWRGLLAWFYSEELRYHHYLQKWVEDNEKNMDILKDRLDKGEIDMNAVLQEALGMITGGDKDAWRVAREDRMKKLLAHTGDERVGDIFWQPKLQDKALKRLVKHRQMASLEVDSDFDGDEPQSGSEDEEGEYDDEERGEWDDVSSDDEDGIAGEADGENP